MTEDQTSARTSVPSSESPVDGQSATPEGGSTGEPQKGNKEARYRVERNAAREALAAAEERIQRMQRVEITRLAGEHLAVGEDIFINGNATESYINDSGEVDAERVRADVQILIGERPRLGKHTGAFDPTQGSGGKPGGNPTFRDLLK